MGKFIRKNNTHKDYENDDNTKLAKDENREHLKVIVKNRFAHISKIYG